MHVYKIFKCDHEFYFEYRIVFRNKINTVAMVVTESSQPGFYF